MAQDLRKVNDIESLMAYFSENLGWAIDPDDYYDIDDITYDFDASDLGLKEEAFAKITSLKQLRPLVDDQRWGIFFVNFESNRFEVSALRKILSGLIPARRNADHAVWDKKDLLFLCTWGERNKVTIGAAHFEDAEKGLPQIKMISCEPAAEDFTQINIFEQRLAKLAWPSNPSDIAAWHEAWASAFTTRYRQTIQDSHTLTIRLAEEAQNIRDRILSTMEIETSNGYVHLLFEKFRATLVHDMTEQQFADMYAQTVVYGLFSARCMDESQEDFNASEAVECIPNTNPFLKGLLQECLGSNSAKSKLSFDELEVGNIVDLLLHTKTDSIITDFNRQTGGGREDPVIHFYEEFLSEYDKTQRVQRGVYYTPQPVVNFIVRAVDDILKHEFDVQDGLASTEIKKIKYKRESKKRRDGYFKTMVEDEMEVPAIQILDPATGTGTFLRQTILQIYSNFCASRKEMPRERIQAEWNQYVPEHLLPRLNGFELMMAPYAVAHMKLAMTLKDTGYNFERNERLQVYLTNSLEEPGNSDNQINLFEDPLAFESVSANSVKKNNGINVVIGNPPYSGISSNNNDYIAELIDKYKYVNGVYFNERKHWLNDDYVKFIRLAQEYISRVNQGIMAFINPHGYIDNPTFRAMRWNLMQEYDLIYILNLHGNINRKEKCPDGSKDENVFDIQQGVSINFFVKNKTQKKRAECKVYYADLYGLRDYKNDFLNIKSLDDIQWTLVIPTEPFYLFKPSAVSERNNYESGFKLTDLFTEYTAGVITARDGLAIDFTQESLIEKISQFASKSLTDDAVRQIFWPGKKAGKYLPGDSRGWSVSTSRKKISNNNHAEYIREITYRPFDFRYIYYSPDVIDWGREKVLSALEAPNIGLISARSNKSGRSDHFYITEHLAEAKCGESTTQSTVFPLYVDDILSAYSMPNLNQLLCSKIAASSGHRYDYRKRTFGIESGIWGPYDIIYYIYAIMYSDKYRNAYTEKLNMEFPIIPFPSHADAAIHLIQLGHELAEVHLMHFSKRIPLNFNMQAGNCLVEKYKYDGFSNVSINTTQAFSNINPSDWNFSIGGYQPLQKYLKDRKGYILSSENIEHYEKIVWAIRQSQQLTKAIDIYIEL